MQFFEITVLKYKVRHKNLQKTSDPYSHLTFISVLRRQFTHIAILHLTNSQFFSISWQFLDQNLNSVFTGIALLLISYSTRPRFFLKTLHLIINDTAVLLHTKIAAAVSNQYFANKRIHSASPMESKYSQITILSMHINCIILAFKLVCPKSMGIYILQRDAGCWLIKVEFMASHKLNLTHTDVSTLSSGSDLLHHLYQSMHQHNWLPRN